MHRRSQIAGDVAGLDDAEEVDVASTTEQHQQRKCDGNAHLAAPDRTPMKRGTATMSTRMGT